MRKKTNIIYYMSIISVVIMLICCALFNSVDRYQKINDAIREYYKFNNNFYTTFYKLVIFEKI